MAIVETAARRPAPRKRAAKTAPKREATQPDEKLIASIRELAWTGQHARAVEQCTRALETIVSGKPLPVAAQMDLLDLRSESDIALGKLDLAACDAAAMLQLAADGKAPALKARALCRQAMVQMRQGM